MSETLLDGLRHKVLRALTRNREPGYHFIGRFLDTTFEKVATAETRILLDTDPYCMETNGTAVGKVDNGIVAVSPVLKSDKEKIGRKS
jgi:hypothetical protein